MKYSALIALATLTATPALSEGDRHVDAHEHGVGELNIAVEDNQVSMELHVPGADIVGFEYEAKSQEDIEAVDTGLAKLSAPLELFELSAAAGCSTISASSILEGEEDHAAHGHDEHAHDDHGDEHGDEAAHSQFFAQYALECQDIAKLTDITFTYFDVFPNALEVEVTLLSDAGAMSYEVERAAPKLEFGNEF